MMRTAVTDRFRGRVAIVTGGSSGIGRAIALELLKEGAKVMFSGIEADLGLQAESEWLRQGYACRFLCGNMADEQFCETIVNETIQDWGRIDYLVNNAFSFLAKSLDAATEDWQYSLSAGPLAYARMMQLAADPMKREGGGAIVNVSSVSAHIAQRNRWTYNVAKAAVHQLTKCAALDLAPFGIRVNSVSPAMIWTRELQKGLEKTGDPQHILPIWQDYHMLRRIGQPVECAGPVLFLLSDDASFITAADLPIDGGFLGMGPQGLGQHVTTGGSR